MPPAASLTVYAELHCLSNFSFLRGASRGEELVERAAELGYAALAVTDECSMAGVVRAHRRVRELREEEGVDFKLIVGAEFALGDGFRLVALVRDGAAYSALCALITEARRAAAKGEYHVDDAMLERAGLDGCCLLLVPPYFPSNRQTLLPRFAWFRALGPCAFLALELHYGPQDVRHADWLASVADELEMALVAAGDVHMHVRARRALQDALVCVRHGCTLDTAGRRLYINGERHLRDLRALASIYPEQTLRNSVQVAELCNFSLDSLDYRYPREVVPAPLTPAEHLRRLVEQGAIWRWPDGVSDKVRAQLEHELVLVSEMQYESYFLTVHDLVRFARGEGILCQGRGSAANSAVCYCLGITEVDPTCTRLLFERFISKERDEPPDIDVDFEHERREEVIQYIYTKYGRHRAALAATVISYRKRSAVRDLGKVFGLSTEQIDALSKSLAWWDGTDVVGEHLEALGFDPDSSLMKRFLWLLPELLGFPRHLSQHVGGFVISDRDLSTLVPVENAAMVDRTIIQWDKDDLETLGLLKVDVLALGMLTAISKCFALLESSRGIRHTMATIPGNDEATYDMICRADTIGVFQIESRAQMSMLPRLRPRNWYDLVIEVSIVRPGPIQGGMVHPYLKRRQGIEPITYPNAELEAVLERTLGIPIFQEQVMEIAMVAAGFSAGEADRLRRSMAAWKKSGQMDRFREPVIQGMLANGYEADFAESIFKQIQGFGEYGFPESHAASFALLVYVSCWLKCHEPAAFLCAMLNSQPLGFYDVSELTQDAQRHGVTVLPVDINQSRRDHALVVDRQRETNRSSFGIHPQPAVRLGLRIVARLSDDGIDRLLAAREHGAFGSAEDVVRRSGIDRRDRQALANAGALERISGHRHQAQWSLLGVEDLPGLLNEASAVEPELDLPAPSEGEDVVADYTSVGLTLGRHPLALLRESLRERKVLDSGSWKSIPDGRPARLAGLVKLRQRPGTAKGTMFITIEDEYGAVQVILWPAVVEAYRKELLGSRLLCVQGMTQREQGVSSLIARRAEDLSWMLGELTVSARNFH